MCRPFPAVLTSTAMEATTDAAAPARARTDAAPRAKSVTREYAETILICVIFVIFSRAFVFQQSKIPSG